MMRTKEEKEEKHEEAIEKGVFQGFTNQNHRAGALLRGLGGPALPQINHCFSFFFSGS